MSWSRIIATGSGRVDFRVSIEGFPYEVVSHASMAVTASDGRIRYPGLISDQFQLSEKVDIPMAKWTPEGFRLTIADVNRRWTEAFRKPTKTTYLAATCTDGAATMTVKATTGFSASGRLWANTETLAFTAANTAGTVFQGVTRGEFGSLAQAHYTADGERQRFPEVTNWPKVREGRRVKVYAYGAGDNRADTSPTAGTLIWTGVVSTEPTFDGLHWTISVDPPTRKWDQEIGGDLEDPTGIRGIYYPASAPLVFYIAEHTNDDYAGGIAVDWTGFAFAGFWETQQEFCTALTTFVQGRMSALSYTQTVTAVPMGERWGFEYWTAAASPKYLRIGITSALDALPESDSEYPREAVGGAYTSTVAVSTRYVFGVVGGGTEPRAVYGTYDPSRLALLDILDANTSSGVDVATNPPNRVYLAGSGALSANITALMLDWDSTGPHADDANSGPIIGTEVTVNTSSRHLTITAQDLGPEPPEGTFWSAVGWDSVEARMGRTYGVGHLGDFIDALTADVPEFLNAGGVPDIRASDFTAMASTDIPTMAAASPLTQNRSYTVFAPVSFRDVLEQECRLLGVFPAFASDGTVTFRRIRSPGIGEAVAQTITAADIITGGEWLSYEVCPLGVFNTVDFKTGYDPTEEEHTGTTHRVRDVEGHGQNPDGRVLEVAPLSVDRAEGFEYGDIVRQFGTVLGVFGAEYRYLTIRVKLTLFSLLIGDVVSLTWDKIPNSDGTLGVTDQPSIVVGRNWDLRSGTGQLTLMVSDQNVAGYTPSSRITGAITGTTGTTGPFGTTLPSTYFPAGTDADDFWEADDHIRLFEWGTTATGNNVTGVITSANANNITFTTDANWNHSGLAWAVGSVVSTSVDEANQKKFAYVADATAIVDFASGDTGRDAFTMGA